MQANMSPVAIRTMQIQQEGIIIHYPHIHLPHLPEVERTINAAIFQQMQSIIHQQQEQQGTSTFTEMIGGFEIKTNERNVLSLTLSNYAYAFQHAHGLTIIQSLTFDVPSGKQYSLTDLFTQGSSYVEVLSKIVHEQIKERDIPLLGEFTHISPTQDFYIADKALVLYFQLYELSPYYVGLPMFPISVYSIEDIIVEDGPLGRMLPA